MSDDGHKSNAARDVAFGSVAGMTSKLFEHPFDLVKVRLQSQPTDRPASFTGPLDCFKQTVTKEGWKGLYRGVSMPLVGAAAENACLFLVYNKCQDVIRAVSGSTSLSEKARGKRRELTIGEKALAAGAAGASASFILTPIELVKCRMQVQMLVREGTLSSTPFALFPATASHSRPYSTTTIKPVHPLKPPIPLTSSLPPLQGPVSLVRSTIARHGLRGLWLGQSGTLLRETGGSSAWFSTYELVSGWFIKRHQSHLGDPSTPRKATKSDLKTWQLMTSGAAAGIAYNVVLFPADSVKSAMQTEDELRPASSSKGSVKRRGFVQVAKEIYARRGLRGLYAGCGLTCLRSAPSSAMIFLIYETLESNFGVYFA